MGFDAESMGRDFGDALGEATATRVACGLFNFSFLARARLEGPDALSAIAGLTQRPMADLKVGHIRYALHCNAAGYVVSDITVWRSDESTFEVFSGLQSDIAVLAQGGHSCRVTDFADCAVLALQGPTSLHALAKVTDVEKIARLGYFMFCRTKIAGCECNIGRLGYTGEAGFEIILENQTDFSRLWDLLAQVARPCGYRAAEMLRIEAGFSLFTQEFHLPVFPSELGMAKYACSTQAGPQLKLISFLATGLEPHQIWRPSLDISRPDRSDLIAVTSASYSALAGKMLGLGFVLADSLGDSLRYTDVNGALHNITRVSHPFYDPEKRRPRLAWLSRR